MSLNDEMYEFLTKPENWRTAKEISDNVLFVKNRLIEEFSNEVRASIEKQIDTKEWKVDFDDSPLNIGLSHCSWRDLFSIHIQFDTKAPQLFVWCKYDKLNKTLQKKLVNDLKEKDKRLKGYSADESEWSGWFYTEDDFKGASLEKILPVNRQMFVEKYSKILIDLKDKVTDVINNVVKQIG